jgi:Karyopherin (importin) beta
VVVALLLPHSSAILELIHRCLADDERTDAVMKLSYGLLGDLADCFPDGQLKQVLLTEWIAVELRSKLRMPSETKKTMRWAREVGIFLFTFLAVGTHSHRSQRVKRATEGQT